MSLLDPTFIIEQGDGIVINSDSRCILANTPHIRINREFLFDGGGMLNTFVHVVSWMYFRSGTTKYGTKEIHTTPGEYQCLLNSFDRLHRVNGRGRYSAVNSLQNLHKNGIIRIRYDELSRFYTFQLNPSITKKIFKPVLHVTDYAPTTHKGYIFVPRNLAQFLPSDYRYSECDALWDIITSICIRDERVLWSQKHAVYVPMDADGVYHRIISFDYLARRWHWSKSSVSAFFEKYVNILTLKHIDGVQGSIVFVNNAVLTSGLIFNEKITKVEQPMSKLLPPPALAEGVRRRKYDRDIKRFLL